MGFLRNNWEEAVEVPKALKSLSSQLQIWNKVVYGNIFQRKRRVLARIGGIHKVIAWRGNPFLYQLEEALATEYRQILRQEEIHWY